MAKGAGPAPGASAAGRRTKERRVGITRGRKGAHCSPREVKT
jgi:hypothetical protein